jgi:hypothetical protein
MTIPSRLRLLVAFACLTTFVATSARAQTAPLTNSVSGAVFNGTTFTDYIINGQNDPTLTLYRGVTYVFQVRSGFLHPFDIKTNSTTTASDRYNNGVTGQGATTTDLTFAVPLNAPNSLFYHCEVHPQMGGTLNIIDPPPGPPTVTIVYIAVTDNLVTVHSTGATNWTAIPEFSSNLTASAWSTVPNYTNSFASGTNITTFDRLDAICGPNVFLRVRNQSN